jgi:hypothetical protein
MAPHTAPGRPWRDVRIGAPHTRRARSHFHLSRPGKLDVLRRHASPSCTVGRQSRAANWIRRPLSLASPVCRTATGLPCIPNPTTRARRDLARANAASPPPNLGTDIPSNTTRPAIPNASFDRSPLSRATGTTLWRTAIDLPDRILAEQRHSCEPHALARIIHEIGGDNWNLFREETLWLFFPKTPRNSSPKRKRGNTRNFLAYASGYEQSSLASGLAYCGTIART